MAFGRSIMGHVQRLLFDILKAYQPILPTFPALLGDGRGTISVSGKPNFVYIRMGAEGEDGLTVAFNQRVPLSDGQAIIVGYTIEQPRLFQVISQREVYAGTGQTSPPQVVAHAPTHAYPVLGDPSASGSDMGHWHWRQMQGLRTVHVSSFTVQLEPWLIGRSTFYQWISTQTLDLSSDKPLSGARYVLTFIDSTGTFQRRLGPVVPSSTLNVDDHAPVCLPGEFPSALVRLYRGQSALEETRESQDILDARWPYAVSFHTICGDSHVDAVGTPVEGDVLTFLSGYWKPSPGGGGGGGGGEQVIVPRWHFDGPLAVVDEIDGVWRLPLPFRVDSVIIYLQTIGTADATTVDVEKSLDDGLTWDSCFAVPGNRPSIIGGGASHVDSGFPATPEELDAGVWLRASIVAVGVGARSLTVQIGGGSEPTVGSDLTNLGCG